MDQEQLQKDIKKYFAVDRMPRDLWFLLKVVGMSNIDVANYCSIAPQRVSLYSKGYQITQAAHRDAIAELVDHVAGIVEDMMKQIKDQPLKEYFGAMLDLIEETD